MKKLTIRIILAVILIGNLFLLTACGTNTNSTTNKDTDTDQVTPIGIWVGTADNDDTITFIFSNDRYTEKVNGIIVHTSTYTYTSTTLSMVIKTGELKTYSWSIKSSRLTLTSTDGIHLSGITLNKELTEPLYPTLKQVPVFTEIGRQRIYRRVSNNQLVTADNLPLYDITSGEPIIWAGKNIYKSIPSLKTLNVATNFELINAATNEYLVNRNAVKKTYTINYDGKTYTAFELYPIENWIWS